MINFSLDEIVDNGRFFVCRDCKHQFLSPHTKIEKNESYEKIVNEVVEGRIGVSGSMAFPQEYNFYDVCPNCFSKNFISFYQDDY